MPSGPDGIHIHTDSVWCQSPCSCCWPFCLTKRLPRAAPRSQQGICEAGNCRANQFLHFLWKDFPGLQPFQVEERRKRDELQVPEFQTCQQTALTQSTCPGKGGGESGGRCAVCMRATMYMVGGVAWCVLVCSVVRVYLPVCCVVGSVCVCLCTWCPV